MKLNRILWALLVALMIPAVKSHAIGWPANYGGVMLQGFYWDSYKAPSGQTERNQGNASDYQTWNWNVLKDNAPEISQYFDLMWLPNSCKSEGGEGYHPIYWFSNFNSAYGTEAEYEAMRQAFQSRGVGLIAEAVLNHRTGETGWVDFPYETWRDETMHIGLDGICCDDECTYIADPSKPHEIYDATGNKDTGGGWEGARDLDHTNANVQHNIISWEKFMLEDKGYVGFRYDYVKGFAPRYITMYNQAAMPTFSVGEFWGGYDEIVGWIDATGGESAAFDFNLKFEINNAFSGTWDMRKLAWLAGDVYQPAGLIHQPGNRRLAVTFVDNHDTFKEPEHNYPFPQKTRIGAAYAFILSQPGTPCVLLQHWHSNKAEIKKLIDARKLAGITNTSPVRVMRYEEGCYMAEVAGTKGTLVVKIGWNSGDPAGYSSSEIQASGTDYCVWVKTRTAPSKMYLLGDVKGWSSSEGVEMTKTGATSYTATNVTLPAAANDTYSYFSFATSIGSNWDAVNSNYRYGPNDANLNVASTAYICDMGIYAPNINASSCPSFKIVPGTYDITIDIASMTLTVTDPGANPDPDPDPTPDPDTYPAHVYIQGTLPGGSWSTSYGIEMTKDGGVYTAEDVTFDIASSSFSFCTALGADWDAVNASARYGAATKDVHASLTAENAVTLYEGNNASSCKSWKVANGVYDITLNLAEMTMTIVKTGDYEIEEPEPEPEPEPDTYSVYVHKPSNWNTVRAHYWGGTAEATTWPGVEMTQFDGDVYKITFTSCSPANIIFHNNSGNQTNDLDFVAGKVYTVSSPNESKSNASTKDYHEFAISYDNHVSAWSNVYVFIWEEGTQNKNAAWPGKKMTQLPASVMAKEGGSATSATHKYVGGLDFEPTNVIFNDGVNNSGNQTADLDWTDGDTYKYLPAMPAEMYVIGTINNNNWNPNAGVAMTKTDDGTYVAAKVDFTKASSTDNHSYFSFTTVKDANWATVNKSSRYGAMSKNCDIVLGNSYEMMLDDSGDPNAWMFTNTAFDNYGYRVEADFVTYTIKVTKNDYSTGIDAVGTDCDTPVEYYTLQGIRVDRPAAGQLYIVRRGSEVKKVIIAQ